MTTRAQIFADVLADINREDKADRLPGWLSDAENIINQSLRVEQMLTRATLDLSEMVFKVPPDFLAPKSITVRSGVTGDTVLGTPKNPLNYIPADQLENGWATPVEPGINPRWYTIRGHEIEMGGWTAPGPFQIDMRYYGRIPPLSLDTSSNWLSIEHTTLYKNAMKHFAFQHLQEFAVADRFMGLAVAQIQEMNDKNDEKKYGAGPLIARPARRIGGRHS